MFLNFKILAQPLNYLTVALWLFFLAFVASHMIPPNVTATKATPSQPF